MGLSGNQRNYVLVELIGLEPTTPCLQSRCSSQLSYSPGLDEYVARNCFQGSF